MGVLQGENGRISPKIPLLLLSQGALGALSLLLLRDGSEMEPGLGCLWISLSTQNLLLPTKPNIAEQLAIFLNTTGK